MKNDPRARPRNLVCLLGSSKFRAEFARAQIEEAVAGSAVVAPPFEAEDLAAAMGDRACTTALVRSYDALVERADEALVINPGGHLDAVTRDRIRIAVSTGTVLRWVAAPHCYTDGVSLVAAHDPPEAEREMRFHAGARWEARRMRYVPYDEVISAWGGGALRTMTAREWGARGPGFITSTDPALRPSEEDLRPSEMRASRVNLEKGAWRTVHAYRRGGLWRSRTAGEELSGVTESEVILEVCRALLLRAVSVEFVDVTCGDESPAKGEGRVVETDP